MNKDLLHAAPAASHTIAIHPEVSAAKAVATKLRKRPEDELLASADAIVSDDVVVAQAPAAAAEGAAGNGAAAGAAGGAAPAAGAEAAAGGSASAGAGAPAILAAAGGGGSGLGTGAIAVAGAAGVAAAAGGGGGGGGGNETAVPAMVSAPSEPAPVTAPPVVAPPVVTPPPPPPPAPAQIHNFGEYVAAINAGGATSATPSLAAAGNPTSEVEITGGFARGTLPQTLADLRPSMSYAVSGASVTSIDDGGIAVDLQGNPDAFVFAHTNAAAGESQLMWMQRLAATDQAGQGRTVLIASSSADGAGADAETGIQHVSMDMAAAGAINTRADLIAAATAGGTAHTLIDDVTLHMDSSGAGSAAAPISSYVHLGENAGDPAGMIASADGAGSSATLAVAGDVALSGQGDEVYVYNSGLFATGTNGGAASSSIGGDVSLISDGRDAHAYLLVQSSTDVAAGSSADVHVAGDVDLHSIGTEAALTRAAVRADGEGTVELDGHLNLVSDATSANSFLQVISQGAGHIAIDSIGMNVDGGGHGWMDLYTDHAGGLDIGSVDLSATAGSDVTLRLQHANDAADPSSVIDPTFLAHGDSTAALSIATANVGGAGDVHMFLDTQGFGTINEAASVARLDIHYQLADQDFAGIGATPLTTINGYKGEIIYNGVLADSTNFANAGSFSTLGDLNAGLDAALDGTHKYVFAVYGGSEDINGNGLADDQNAGVLAWDDNGTGMTSVVVLPGVTALTPNDIA